MLPTLCTWRRGRLRERGRTEAQTEQEAGEDSVGRIRVCTGVGKVKGEDKGNTIRGREREPSQGKRRVTHVKGREKGRVG